MPVYPYSCDECHKYEEIFIKLADFDAAPRPVCHGPMRRVYTPPYVVSDNLGVQGIVNPATGKSYDSKSEYYASVKAAGCHIVGDDASKGNKKNEQDHNVRKELKDAINKHMGS